MLRAALITTLGESPVVRDIDDAPADALRMLAVALSPVDIAVGSGRFAAGHPPLPYVIGHEGVGEGTAGLVYVTGGGIGITADGLAAERRLVPVERTIPIPAAADPAVVAALGTAGVAGWSAVTDRGAVRVGDRVVVRGASGSAGRVAVQAAREAGARTVVGVGRGGERLTAVAHLCDAIVTEGDDLTGRIVDAADGGVDLLVDFTWGPQAASAMAAVVADGRVVVAGGAGGPTAEIASPLLLARRLDVRGYSNFGLSPDEFARTFHALIDRWLQGRLEFPVRRVPLADVAAAWEATRTSAAKCVIDFEEVRGA